jgi:hypothetical protein
MGEVWHAFDEKLRVEVALKSVRSEHFSGEKGREFLRQEIRAARDVVSTAAASKTRPPAAQQRPDTVKAGCPPVMETRPALARGCPLPGWTTVPTW